jgi:hypothetical protein
VRDDEHRREQRDRPGCQDGDRACVLVVAEVDGVAKRRDGCRGSRPRSVNIDPRLLAQILDDAVDYELLTANPARGAAGASR